MDSYIYYNPVKLISGNGKVSEVGKEITPYGKKVLFVYGQKHLKANGNYDKIKKSLVKEGLDVTELAGVKPNPRLSLVKEGIKICKEKKIDFILAAGGGSTSDTAKAIGIGSKVDYDVWQAYEDFHNVMHGNKGDFPHVPTESIPFGVIMTKPGTGSEFDYTSVLSNREALEKLMVINYSVYAKFAIHDPLLTHTLPQSETAYGIADMMTHVMEQYFTLSDNVDLIDRYKEANLIKAMESAKIIMENPFDDHARENLLYIAAWACSAQSMTGTLGSWAAHQIEHELSALTDLNHGHGMAIVFLGWLKYLLPELEEKLAKYASRVFGINGSSMTSYDLAIKGIKKTADFWKSMGISLKLSECGITDSDIRKAAKQAVRFGPLGIVKVLHEEDVYKILKSVL
jgi:alcohol dehydrogenase YqhD (iron-dependent ADH family)